MVDFSPIFIDNHLKHSFFGEWFPWGLGLRAPSWKWASGNFSGHASFQYVITTSIGTPNTGITSSLTLSVQYPPFYRQLSQLSLDIQDSLPYTLAIEKEILINSIWVPWGNQNDKESICHFNTVFFPWYYRLFHSAAARASSAAARASSAATDCRPGTAPSPQIIFRGVTDPVRVDWFGVFVTRIRFFHMFVWIAPDILSGLSEKAMGLK